jgi:3-deoxy-manno-octulosonate cytidylyltransferase (CMP-KDO synthetase)
MKILAIIPARMGSSRFPGKPMAMILGKPMIGHVYSKVSLAKSLDLVCVATCDLEIYEYIKSIGGCAVMTRDDHERASDRCSEALAKLEVEDGVKYDIVVMVQGDEPLIHPDMIDEAVQPMICDPDIQVINLLGEICSEAEFKDRNCIKVVHDLNFNALYFSREPIPTRSKNSFVAMGKQVCVIPFRRDYLVKYNQMNPTPLEIIESIDMMRILEHGGQVKMVKTSFVTQSVDTPEDLINVENSIKSSVV